MIINIVNKSNEWLPKLIYCIANLLFIMKMERRKVIFPQETPNSCRSWT